MNNFTILIIVVCMVNFGVCVDDNGLNPYWDCSTYPNNDSSFDFDIHSPDNAFLRFTAYDQDMFGDPNFLAVAVIPVSCIKLGKCYEAR